MLAAEALTFQSTGIFVPVFMEKIFICLGCLITDALTYSLTYVVENICSILQQLVGKRAHMFKHFGGFKFLADVLHCVMNARTDTESCRTRMLNKVSSG